MLGPVNKAGTASIQNVHFKTSWKAPWVPPPGPRIDPGSVLEQTLQRLDVFRSLSSKYHYTVKHLIKPSGPVQLGNDLPSQEFTARAFPVPGYVFYAGMLCFVIKGT